jgi:peptide/nickel transport system ATP-binding protein
MALSTSPSILIADEPTTALDVTIQAQILDLLMKIQDERKMSLLLITHDLGIVANIADEIAIMYAGEIVEYGTTADIFRKPGHPYTRGLFNAIPRIGENRRELRTIPGMVPAITVPPEECVFYPRCDIHIEECALSPVALKRFKGRSVRCIRYRAG